MDSGLQIVLIVFAGSVVLTLLSSLIIVGRFVWDVGRWLLRGAWSVITFIPRAVWRMI